MRARPRQGGSLRAPMWAAHSIPARAGFRAGPQGALRLPQAAARESGMEVRIGATCCARISFLPGFGMRAMGESR